QLRAFFEQAEQSFIMKRMPADIQVPHVPHYPRISKELSALYSGLRTAFEKKAVWKVK
ncbi:hypothetical protein ACWHAR_25130, partial [Bacillus sp. LR--39]